jgi:acyl-CoA thioesterase FadM
MTRRTVEIPDTFQFKTSYRVVYSDINAAKHLAADRLLPIALEAQFRFIKSLGYQDAIVFEDAGLIMVHSETEYKSESFHDDELNVEMSVAVLEGKKIELVFLVSNPKTKLETARIRISNLFFDYETQKVTEAPVGFINRLKTVYGLSF